MIIERKSIRAYTSGAGLKGYIDLEKLAKPETVKVMIEGEEIVPCSFDCFGKPHFTSEQVMLCTYGKEEKYRKYGSDSELEMIVQYEEAPFNIPLKYFDTLEGINDSLTSLSSLNEVLELRKKYRKVNENNRLNEFVLFGRYYLDCFGQVLSLNNYNSNSLVKYKDIEVYSDYILSKKDSLWNFDKYVIPENDSFCPCCGKKFTLEDIKNGFCLYIEGKYYHDSCYLKYRKLKEIDFFTRNMISLVYKREDYTYDLLPNGYCNLECCINIPWFMFHTPDGDIKMGWRKRVIFIEWQENYKSFDFNKLFGQEDVTKWSEKGKCGIHAWGRDVCFDYLTKVVKEVNPEYSIWK